MYFPFRFIWQPILSGVTWFAKDFLRMVQGGYYGISKKFILNDADCDALIHNDCKQPQAGVVSNIPLPFFKVDCEALIKTGYLMLYNIKTEESRYVTISNTTLQDVNHDVPNNKAAREVSDRDDDENDDGNGEYDDEHDDNDDDKNYEGTGEDVQDGGFYEGAVFVQDFFGHLLVADPRTKEQQGQFEFRMCPGNRSEEYWHMAGFLWYGRLTPSIPGHKFWRSRICIQAEALNNTDQSEYVLAATSCGGKDFDEGKALGFTYGPNPATDLQFVGMTPDNEANTTEPMFRVNVDDNNVLKMPYFDGSHLNATHHGHAGDWRLRLI